ncbi:hypothetical protein LXL04_009454 [Taraxacum kok-saghyz]
MEETMGRLPRLEDIPELIHHIQLLLPTKEAARTSILSKSWLYAWSTIPTLKLSVTKDQEKMVDCILIRYLRDDIPIESFDFKIDIENQELASHAIKWIRPVVIKTCLTKLFLEIMVTNDSFMLPDEILFSKNLNIVRIYCTSNVHFIWMSSRPVINSVSLRELDLKHVYIREKVLDDIFSTCCLLEKIKLIDCKGFKTIKVKNLCSLYELAVVSDESDGSVLEIDHVPKLRLFSCDIRFVTLPANPLTFNLVTQLSLGGDVITENMIKTNFPFLKILSLDMEFWSLPRLSITSASLNRFSLLSCPGILTTVHVNAPRLDFFSFEGERMPNLAISLLKKMKLALSLNNPVRAPFFHNLMQALRLAINCDIEITLTMIDDGIHQPYDHINIVNVLRARVPFPATNVQRLSFKTIGDDGVWDCSPFFDALFSICHPKHVVANPDAAFERNNHFCMVMVSEVMGKKKARKARGYVHWPYYLKGYETKSENGETLPDYLGSYLDRLDDPAVCVVFKLNWRGFGGFKRVASGESPWARLIALEDKLHDKGVVDRSILRRKVRDGQNTLLWLDTWNGDQTLAERFHRLAVLDVVRWRIGGQIKGGSGTGGVRYTGGGGGVSAAQIVEMGNILKDVRCVEGKDGWSWEINLEGFFTVASTRNWIDENVLPDAGIKSRWCSWIPKKVNIFVWRVLRNRLPTRGSLQGRGIHLETVRCPLCNEQEETVNHLLGSCTVANAMWGKVFRWMQLQRISVSSMDQLFDWLEGVKVSKDKKKLIEVILCTTLWGMWRYRNDVIHESRLLRKNMLFDFIQDFSFNLCSSRQHKLRISWVDWLQQPLRSL